MSLFSNAIQRDLFLLTQLLKDTENGFPFEA